MKHCSCIVIIIKLTGENNGRVTLLNAFNLKTEKYKNKIYNYQRYIETESNGYF